MEQALNTAQLQELLAELNKLEASLRELLEATEAGEKPVKLKDNQGRLSRMDEMHNQSILKANRNLTRNRLKAVLEARGRFDTESYGFCLECGENITFNRLKAYPDASLCLACKADQES